MASIYIIIKKYNKFIKGNSNFATTVKCHLNRRAVHGVAVQSLIIYIDVLKQSECLIRN